MFDAESVRFNLTCATCGKRLLKENADRYEPVRLARNKAGWTQNPNPVCGPCATKVQIWRDGKPRLVLRKRARRG